MNKRGRLPFGSRINVNFRSRKRSSNSAPGRLPVIAASWQKRRSCIRYQPQGNVISVVDRITRANSATSSIYMVAFGLGWRESFSSFATIASTCDGKSDFSQISVTSISLRITHVADFHLNVFAKFMSNLGLVNQMPPFP